MTSYADFEAISGFILEDFEMLDPLMFGGKNRVIDGW